MATCKECYHEEICDMPIITDGRKNADNCNKFKNKADFVEVVRCKDCRYKKVVYYQTRAYYCTHPESGLKNIDGNTDFCSYGQRQ